MKTPSQEQRRALEMATRDPDGIIVRKPGGYWIGQSTKEPAAEKYLGTTTMDACRTRGWMESIAWLPQGDPKAYKITAAGLEIIR